MKTVTEKQVRDCFKIIIEGEGTLIPRIAVKCAVDSLFDDFMEGSKTREVFPLPKEYGKTLDRIR